MSGAQAHLLQSPWDGSPLQHFSSVGVHNEAIGSNSIRAEYEHLGSLVSVVGGAPEEQPGITPHVVQRQLPPDASVSGMKPK